MVNYFIDPCGAIQYSYVGPYMYSSFLHSPVDLTLVYANYLRLIYLKKKLDL